MSEGGGDGDEGEFGAEGVGFVYALHKLGDGDVFSVAWDDVVVCEAIEGGAEGADVAGTGWVPGW